MSPSHNIWVALRRAFILKRAKPSFKWKTSNRTPDCLFGLRNKLRGIIAQASYKINATSSASPGVGSSSDPVS